MYTDMYEIIDDNDVIYSGSREYIFDIWDRLPNESDELIGDFDGDLKLIQVHDVWNG